MSHQRLGRIPQNATSQQCSAETLVPSTSPIVSDEEGAPSDREHSQITKMLITGICRNYMDSLQDPVGLRFQTTKSVSQQVMLSAQEPSPKFSIRPFHFIVTNGGRNPQTCKKIMGGKLLCETSLPSAAPLGCGDSLPYEGSGRRRGLAAAAAASEREPRES